MTGTSHGFRLTRSLDQFENVPGYSLKEGVKVRMTLKKGEGSQNKAQMYANYLGYSLRGSNEQWIQCSLGAKRHLDELMRRAIFRSE